MAQKNIRRFAGNGNDHEIVPDINTTPLIDVMLVLLVMLIITIPVQLHAVNIELPVGKPLEIAIKPDKIQIDIDAGNILYWQGVPTNMEDIDTRLAEAARRSVAPQISLRANQNSKYATFAHVLAASRRNGLSQVAVIGSEQFLP